MAGGPAETLVGPHRTAPDQARTDGPDQVSRLGPVRGTGPMVRTDGDDAMSGKPTRVKGGASVVEVDSGDLLHPKPSECKRIAGSDNGTFNTVLLNSVAHSLWFFRDITPKERNAKVLAAAVAVGGFRPRDEVEGMMAAQAVALHHAAMECLRCAMIPDQPSEQADRLRRQGANLARAMVDMAEAIERRRGKRPQVVRVERVVVQDGGQAIVGAVAPRAAVPTDADAAGSR